MGKGKMLVSKFKKNALEEVRTEISEYEGEQYINIRIWYDASENGQPEFRPSQKGITLNISLYDDLKDAVLKAGKEIEKQLPG